MTEAKTTPKTPAKAETPKAPEAPKKEEKRFVHVVTKVSISNWTDSKGLMWKNPQNPDAPANAKSERKYRSTQPQANFLKTRQDLAWMIEHGEMKITTVDTNVASVEPEYEEA